MIPQEDTRMQGHSYTFTEDQIDIARKSLLGGLRVVVFKDQQGQIQIKTGLNTQKFIDYCAAQNFKNDPALLRVIVDTIFRSTMARSENKDQALASLDKIISVYGDDIESQYELQTIRNEYAKHFYHRPEPLSIDHSRDSSIHSFSSVDSPTTHLLINDLEEYVVVPSTPQSTENKALNPQKTAESLNRMQRTPLKANFFSSSLMKAASALTNNRAITTFPNYGYIDVMSEVQALRKVSQFNPNKKDELATWTSFYAKMRVIDSDPDDTKLHRNSNLAQNTKFMDTLDKSIRYFDELANTPTADDNPIEQGMKKQAAEIVKTFKSVHEKLMRTPGAAEEEKIAKEQIEALVQSWPIDTERDGIKHWGDFYAKMRALNASPSAKYLSQSSPLVANQEFIDNLRSSRNFFNSLGMLSTCSQQDLKDNVEQIGIVLAEVYEKLQRTQYKVDMAIEQEEIQQELNNVNSNWPSLEQLNETNPFSEKAREEIKQSLHEIINGLHTKKEVESGVQTKKEVLLAPGRSVPMHEQGILDFNRTSLLIGDYYSSAHQEDEIAAQRRLSVIFEKLRSLFQHDPRLTDECMGNIVTLADNQSLFAPFQSSSMQYLGMALKEGQGKRIRTVSENLQGELVFTSTAHYLTQQPMDWDIEIPYVPQPVSLTLEIAIPKETILQTGLKGLQEKDYRIRYQFKSEAN